MCQGEKKPAWGNGNESLGIAQGLSLKWGCATGFERWSDGMAIINHMDLGWAVPPNCLLCLLSWVKPELQCDFFTLHITLWGGEWAEKPV